MNFLITGATGFIGRKLVATLLAGGHGVNYLARRRSQALDSRAAFHYWDPRHSPPLDSVPRLDAVVHLAGEPIAQRWTAEVKKRIYASRVNGTRALIAGLERLRHKPSVLISASAVGYYGDRSDEILNESSQPGTDFLARVCVDWESEAVRARDFGLRVVPLRIATVLGKEGGALPRILTPFKLGLGGKFGSGRQWMSWIHVDDLTALILFAAENPGLAGAVNASSPVPVTNADFTRILAGRIHRPALFAVPKFALRIALGEMASFLFTSQRVVPEAAVNAGFRFRYPQLEQAFSVIN